MARPPENPEDRRTVILQIRLTEAERAELDKAAGDKTSTWARWHLLEIARKQPLVGQQSKARKPN